MKKSFRKILAMALIGLVLTACSSNPTGSSSSEEPSNTPTSSEVSSSEASSSSQHSSSSEGKTTYELKYMPSTYKVGDLAYSNHKFQLEVTNPDGTKLYKNYGSELVVSIKNKETGIVLGKKEKFTIASTYTIYIEYDTTNFKTKQHYDIKVLSGLEAGFTLKSISPTREILVDKGYKFFDSNKDLTFILNYTNNVNEVMTYKNNESKFQLALYKDNKAVDIMTHVGVGGSTYTFTAKLIAASTIEYKIDNIFVSDAVGYVKLDKSTITYSDFDYYPTPVGDIKLLIIPIYLEIGDAPRGHTFVKHEFTPQVMTNIERFFFGDNVTAGDANFSLKSYFENASNHMMNISGEIANIYRVPASKFTMAEVTADESMITLVSLFNDAIEYTLDHNPQINFKEYDSNNDGYFDCVHFINNSGDKAYEGGRKPVSIPWASALWPHQSQVPNDPGSLDRPNARVYESTSISPKHFEDARTITHEQGHMFGIPDYYDYSSSGPDYIGHLDMQSGNYFDWNSWSKFSVGWAKPIVVDGTSDRFSIRLHSAALTNECIIVPANYSTYNNSAFDEYFLIELFTKDGNNKDDWDRLLALDRPRSAPNNINAGIRMYHVDSRLGYIENSIGQEKIRYINTKDDINEANFGSIETITNNTYVYKQYAGSFYKNKTAERLYGDLKQLAIIQAGGVDTFRRTTYQYQYRNNDDVILVQDDLFLTGDTFDFDTYSHFLSKSGKPTTRTNKGEIFPYVIEFTDINKNESVITFKAVN